MEVVVGQVGWIPRKKIELWQKKRHEQTNGEGVLGKKEREKPVTSHPTFERERDTSKTNYKTTHHMPRIELSKCY